MTAIWDSRANAPAADAADCAGASARATGYGVLTGGTVPRFAIPTLAIWLSALIAFVMSTIMTTIAVEPIWVTIPVNAAVTFVMFSVVHEAVHNSIGRKRWINALFGRLAWIFVSPTFSFPSFVFIHLSHHRYANDRANDPDTFATHSPWWQLPFRWAFADLFYVVYYIRRIRSRPTSELAETAVMFGLNVAVLAVAAVTRNLWLLAVVFVIPQRIGLTILAWWFDWLPHHGLEDTPGSNRHRAARIRVGMEWLFTPLMLSQNYHLIHHLHPRVPWYRYLSTWRGNEEAYLQSDVAIATVFGQQLNAHEFREWKGLKLNRKRRHLLPLRMPKTSSSPRRGLYQIPFAAVGTVSSNDNVCAQRASA
jgi:fatty acid desaturase